MHPTIEEYLDRADYTYYWDSRGFYVVWVEWWDGTIHDVFLISMSMSGERVAIKRPSGFRMLLSFDDFGLWLDI